MAHADSDFENDDDDDDAFTKGNDDNTSEDNHGPDEVDDADVNFEPAGNTGVDNHFINGEGTAGIDADESVRDSDHDESTDTDNIAPTTISSEAMNERSGTRSSEHNLRPQRPRDFGHLHTT